MGVHCSAAVEHAPHEQTQRYTGPGAPSANWTENICLSLNSTYSDAKGPVNKSIYDFTLRPDTTKRESVDDEAIETGD